jgi:hypothetical protein
MSDPSAGPAGGRRSQSARGGRRTRAATDGEQPKAPEPEEPEWKKLRSMAGLAEENTVLRVRLEEIRRLLKEGDAAWRAEKEVLKGDLEVVTGLNDSNEDEIAKLRAELDAAKAGLAKAEGLCALEWPSPDWPQALREARYRGVAGDLAERFPCVVTGGLSPWCTRNLNACPECHKQSLPHTPFRCDTYDEFEAYAKFIDFRIGTGDTFRVKCPYCNHAHDYDRSIGPGWNGVEPVHMTPRMKTLEDLLDARHGDAVLRSCVKEAFDDPDALKEYDAFKQATGEWHNALNTLFRLMSDAESDSTPANPRAEADGFAAVCTLLRLVVEYHASGDFDVLLYESADGPGPLDYFVGPFSAQSVRCSIAIAMLAM